MSILDDLQKFAAKSMKKADMGSEDTSHASKGVDNQADPAQTGSRSSENESDVKAQVPGQSVDNASGQDAEGSGRGENAATHDVGTDSAATGEDSAVETNSVKAQPSDPGTSHPAKADSGEKFSSLLSAGERILAGIAVNDAVESKTSEDNEKSGSEEAKESTKESSEKQASDEELKKAKEAGKEAANKLSKESSEKQASDEELKEAKEAGAKAAELLTKSAKQSLPTKQQVITNIVKAAQYDAQLASDYLDGYMKTSAGEELKGDAQLEEGSDTDVESVDAAADEAASAPAEVAEAAPEGQEAAGQEDAIQELAAALVESGISPEDVLAMIGGAPEEGMEAPVDAAMAAPVDAATAAPKLANDKEKKVAAVKSALLKAAEKAS